MKKIDQILNDIRLLLDESDHDKITALREEIDRIPQYLVETPWTFIDRTPPALKWLRGSQDFGTELLWRIIPGATKKDGEEWGLAIHEERALLPWKGRFYRVRFAQNDSIEEVRNPSPDDVILPKEWPQAITVETGSGYNWIGRLWIEFKRINKSKTEGMEEVPGWGWKAPRLDFRPPTT